MRQTEIKAAIRCFRSKDFMIVMDVVFVWEKIAALVSLRSRDACECGAAPSHAQKSARVRQRSANGQRARRFRDGATHLTAAVQCNFRRSINRINHGLSDVASPGARIHADAEIIQAEIP